MLALDVGQKNLLYGSRSHFSKNEVAAYNRRQEIEREAYTAEGI